MHRAEVKASKQMYELEIRKRMSAMAERIATMRPSVDNRTPKGFGEVRRNVKREAMQEARYSEIEAGNRALLERMSSIMSRPPAAEGGVGSPRGRSMNYTARRKELERITEDNQKILVRIQNARPTFNNAKMEAEAWDNARLVESITEYKSRPIGGSVLGSPSPAARRSRSHGASRRALDGALGGSGSGSLAAGGGASVYEETSQLSFVSPAGGAAGGPPRAGGGAPAGFAAAGPGGYGGFGGGYGGAVPVAGGQYGMMPMLPGTGMQGGYAPMSPVVTGGWGGPAGFASVGGGVPAPPSAGAPAVGGYYAAPGAFTAAGGYGAFPPPGAAGGGYAFPPPGSPGASAAAWAQGGLARPPPPTSA